MTSMSNLEHTQEEIDELQKRYERLSYNRDWLYRVIRNQSLTDVQKIALTRFVHDGIEIEQGPGGV